MLNPKVDRPIRSEGWIAPNGLFYLCKVKGHLQRAKWIVWDYYGCEKGEEFLEGKGWIKVFLDGRTMNCNEDRCTQNQLDTMGWLMGVRVGNTDWVVNLEKEIGRYDVS